MFSLIWAWTNGWVNNRNTGDFRCNRAHYDVTVMCCWVKEIVNIATLGFRWICRWFCVPCLGERKWSVIDTNVYWHDFLYDSLLVASARMKQSWRIWVNPLMSLQWRHNECDGVSNHWRLEYLLYHLFRCRSKRASKLCAIGLCEGNPPVTSGFSSQRAHVMTSPSWWNNNKTQKFTNYIHNSWDVLLKLIVFYCDYPCFHYSDTTWALWCLKSPAPQFFVPQIFQDSKEKKHHSFALLAFFKGNRW